MRELTRWIKADIMPSVDGTYYVIWKALQDIVVIGNASGGNELFVKKGEYWITDDYYHYNEDLWDSLGRSNEYWAVEAWMSIPLPRIPEEIREQVRMYFDEKLPREVED